MSALPHTAPLVARAVDSPVRVAVVIPRYAPIFGGAENQCRQLNRELLDQGGVHIPFLVTKRILPNLVPTETIDGVSVHRLGRPGISRWSEYDFYLRAFLFLWRRRNEFDVLHCHATSIIGFVMTVLARIIDKPVVLKLSSNGELVTGMRNFDGRVELEASLSARLRRPLARFMAAHAHIVALNDEGADELRLVGARHPLLQRNGVDTQRFRPAAARERAALRRCHGIADDEFLFVYTGRFVPAKGVDDLLKAIERLRETATPVRIGFMFVGSGALQGGGLAIGAADGVRIMSATDDVLPFLQLADAFVHPSRREGMPNSVLEALAVGLPCVLSDIRPHQELAAQNPRAHCVLFRSGDVAQLAQALLACVSDPRTPLACVSEPRTPLTRSAVDERFHLAEVAARYREIYHMVLE